MDVRGASAGVEDVLADTDVAGAGSLFACMVGEPVLDGHALSQACASVGSRDGTSECHLEWFVGSDRDRATTARRTVRALRAQRAHIAGCCGKSRGIAGSRGLGMACRTRDREARQIDVKITLREEFCAVRAPGFREDGHACRDELRDGSARDVAAIDVQFAELVSLSVAAEVFENPG